MEDDVSIVSCSTTIKVNRLCHIGHNMFSKDIRRVRKDVAGSQNIAQVRQAVAW